MAVFAGGAGNDTLTGGIDNDVLDGGAGNDTLIGGAGNDEFDLGAGNSGKDSMVGGLGNDVYVVDDAGDVVKENAGQGFDTVFVFTSATGTYTLGSNLEALNLNFGSVLNGVGNTANNQIVGNAANNKLYGLAGNDQLGGLDGNDSLYGYIGNDELYGDLGSDLLDGGDGNDELNGGAGNDSLLGGIGVDFLWGGDGNDSLNGGTGADSLLGGAGWDFYVVDNAGDNIAEFVNEGFDRVYTSVSFSLGNNLEDLILGGSGAIKGTGNELDNTLTGNGANNLLSGLDGQDTIVGNAGNDTLNGGAGIDKMEGGTGNDLYYVDNGFDEVIENAGSGIDTVRVSGGGYNLSDNVENLELVAGLNLSANGNELANSIKGNELNNTLSGEGGRDTVAGGAGNDHYVVNLIASGSGSARTLKLEDVLIENANAGTDILNLQGVFTDLINPATLTLAANLEILYAQNTGLTKLNLVGNSANNEIHGNDAGNIIDGGAGVDTLYGYQGDDTYVLDKAGDVVSELFGGGNDTIKLKFTVAPTEIYTLNGDIENLVIGSSARINAEGNASNNKLTGNVGSDTLAGLGGDDTLDGGAGADWLTGGLGNDRYIIDNTQDRIIEQVGGGEEVVFSSISYTLGDNLESLILTGSKAINATGNELSNGLGGNAANNKLFGLAGDDEMDGNAGNDTLDGGTGNDYLGGGTGNDSLIGGEGGDWLDGESGNDKLIGGDSADYLDGGSGNDLLIGGQGDDYYFVDSSADVVVENAGEGTDRIELQFTPLGNYVLQAGIENLHVAVAGNFSIQGNSASNVLLGGAGRDALSGEDGADTLSGGYGNDYLTGGAGADIFLFDTYPDGPYNVDVIEDFTPGTDKIYLDDDIFQGLGVLGDLPSSALKIGPAAGGADNRIVYNNATGELFYDPDGSGAQAQMLFAQIDAGLVLSNTDFNVVA